MKTSKNSEILEELKSVLKGNTIDAIVPPLIFVLMNNLFSLPIAIFSAVGVAACFGLVRLNKKQKSIYAFTGLSTVLLAGLFALIADNATNYFLPGIISNLFLIILMFISIIIRKPLAALASHITRGWTLNWFWRSDIKPAYTEVTWMWLALFMMRTALQINLYIQDSVTQLVWTNLLLGLPFTIIVLVVSYIYGIWRLKQLKGPGIDEYNEHKQPPYKGQTRGF
jgi:hypothetical protein